MSHLKILLTASLFASACALTAHARDIDIDNPDQQDFRAVSEDLAAAFNYKPLKSTEPLGILGFDIGIGASYTSIENEQNWKNLTGSDFEQIGMVAATASKGLPLGFDVSGTIGYIPVADAKVFGAALSYALAEGSFISPAIGIRAAATRMQGIDDFSFETYSLDLSISKGFPFITPYGGIGVVRADSRPDDSTGLNDETFNETKLFVGAQISFLLLNITAEVDKTGDTTTANLRLGAGF